MTIEVGNEYWADTRSICECEPGDRVRVIVTDVAQFSDFVVKRKNRCRNPHCVCTQGHYAVKAKDLFLAPSTRNRNLESNDE